jgi:hypothetical protein
MSDRLKVAAVRNLREVELKTLAAKIFAVFALAVLAPAAQAACIDLGTAHRLAFTGGLRYAIFPGPPGFADVSKGDAPEPAYLLVLPNPICLTGDPDHADPGKPVVTVHLLPKDSTEAAMRALVGSQVSVSLSEPMAAQTGHHRAPLVGWVDAISKAR